MFNRILVGLDGSENSWVASEYGIYLSKVLKKPVVAIHIVDIRLIEGAFLEDIAGALGFNEYDNLSEKVKESLDEKGKVLLEIFAKKCREEGADCSIAQAFGIVGRELVNMADPEDLLIIGRHGKHKNLLQRFLGTTADYVVRHSKCPVMLVSDSFSQIKKLGLFSNDEKVLDFSVKFAKALGLKQVFKLSSIDEEPTEIEGITLKTVLVPFDCEVDLDGVLESEGIDTLIFSKEDKFPLNLKVPAILV